jgi:hypothetical protein
VTAISFTDQYPTPVAIWDASCPSWHAGPWQERSAWVSTHLGRAGATYRVEFYLADTSFAVVYRYNLDKLGRKHVVVPGGAVAKEDPVTVVLTELPPKDLLY